MGMRDESWCAACGKGIHYTPDINAECGECATITAQSEILWFIEVRIKELQESLEGLDINDSMNDYIEGAIDAYEIIKHKFERGYADVK
jgi:Holliday junction resolvase-like predicted endonuclease